MKFSFIPVIWRWHDHMSETVCNIAAFSIIDIVPNGSFVILYAWFWVFSKRNLLWHRITDCTSTFLQCGRGQTYTAAPAQPDNFRNCVPISAEIRSALWCAMLSDCVCSDLVFMFYQYLGNKFNLPNVLKLNLQNTILRPSCMMNCYFAFCARVVNPNTIGRARVE